MQNERLSSLDGVLKLLIMLIIMAAKEQKERAVDPLSAIMGIRMAQAKRKGGVKRG